MNGLPRKMALELFKPLVMNALVIQGYAHNIRVQKKSGVRRRRGLGHSARSHKDHPVF